MLFAKDLNERNVKTSNDFQSTIKQDTSNLKESVIGKQIRVRFVISILIDHINEVSSNKFFWLLNQSRNLENILFMIIDDEKLIFKIKSNGIDLNILMVKP